jgi:ABC-type Co2+ transport system permease subunit
MTIAELQVKIEGNVTDINRKLDQLEVKLREVAQQSDETRKRSGSAFQRLGQTFTKTHLAIAAAIGTITAVGYAFYSVIKPAMDAEEAVSKFNTIFGANAQAVTDWSVQLGREIGRSSREIRSMTADAMALVSGMAGSREQAIGIAEGITRMANDLASFHNVTVQEAFMALRSGISGEAEPMKRFGIIVSDTALAEYALSQGIRKKVEQMSIAEKTQLRYNLMLSKMGAASGDAAMTSTSLTNTMRAIQDIMSDSAVEIGSKMVPGMTKLAQAFKMSLERGNPLGKLLRDIAEGLGNLGETIGENMINSMQFEDVANELSRINGHVYTGIDAWSGMQDAQSAAIDATIRAAGADGNRMNQVQLLIDAYQKKIASSSGLGAVELDRLRGRLQQLEAEMQRMNQAAFDQWLAMPDGIAGPASAAIDQVRALIRLQRQQQSASATANAAAQEGNKAKWQQLHDNLQSMWASYSGFVGDTLAQAEGQELDRYEKMKNQLKEYLRFRLITQDAYNAALEGAERAHTQNMERVRVDFVNNWGAAGRSIASIFASTEQQAITMGNDIAAVFRDSFGSLDQFTKQGITSMVQFFDTIGGLNELTKENFRQFAKDFLIKMMSMLEAQVAAHVIAAQAIAWAKVPIDFGASLATVPVMLAKVAAIMATFEALKAGVRKMADGGLVTGPTYAMVGEGRDSEAVLPLNKDVFSMFAAGIVEQIGAMSARQTGVVNNYYGGGGGGSRTIQVVMPDGKVLAEVVDDERERKAYFAGGKNYATESVY